METGDAGLMDRVAEFMRTCPGHAAIPMAAMAVMAPLASTAAQALVAKEGGRETTGDMEAKGVQEHLAAGSKDEEEFLFCWHAICRGYLATQYTVRNHWAPMRVDLHRLRIAMADSLDTRVEVFSAKDNLEIAATATAISVQRSNSRFRGLVKPEVFATDVCEIDGISLEIAKLAVLGAAVWHQVDNLYAGGHTVTDVKEKVFLSYVRADKRRAMALERLLKEGGYEVWRDEKDIAVGSSVPDGIAKGISECSFMVLLMSKHSLNSTWVASEIDQAVLREHQTGGHVFLLPVRLDDTAIPPHLNVKRYADATKSTRKAAAEVLAAMKRHNAHL